MTNTTTATETTGTCQICEKVCKMVRGLTSLHGYARPGHGWIEGQCMGAKAAEWERSSALVSAWIARLEARLATTTEVLTAATNPATAARVYHTERHYIGANGPEYIGRKPKMVPVAVEAPTNPALIDLALRKISLYSEEAAHIKTTSAERSAYGEWVNIRARKITEWTNECDALRSEIARQSARLASWVATR